MRGRRSGEGKRGGRPAGRTGRIAVFPVSGRGLRLAERIREGTFEGVEVFGPPAPGGLSRAVGRALAEFDGVVFISATGIAVRTIAPYLKGKNMDPAVVVMDEHGSFSISLVSGHLGGANRLARELAGLTGAAPVVTTATDVWGLPSVEDIAERFSLAVEDVGVIKAVNSAILASMDEGGRGRGPKVLVVDGSAGRRGAIRRFLEEEYPKSSGVFSFGSVLSERRSADAYVLITEKAAPEVPGPISKRTLVLRPTGLVLGIGCRRGAGSKEIEAAVDAALSGAGISRLCVGKIATIDIKRGEPGLNRFARAAGLEVEYHAAESLASVRPPSGGSARVLEATGTGSVSEAAALISSGARSLCIRKLKTEKVTVAAARGPFTYSG